MDESARDGSPPGSISEAAPEAEPPAALLGEAGDGDTLAAAGEPRPDGDVEPAAPDDGGWAAGSDRAGTETPTGPVPPREFGPPWAPLATTAGEEAAGPRAGVGTSGTGLVATGAEAPPGQEPPEQGGPAGHEAPRGQDGPEQGGPAGHEAPRGQDGPEQGGPAGHDAPRGQDGPEQGGPAGHDAPAIRPRRRATLLVLAGVALAIVAAGVVFVVVRGHRPPIPPATETSGPFLAAWGRQDWATMAALVDAPPPDFAAVNRAALADVHATHSSFSALPFLPAKRTASVPFTAHLQLAGLGTWTYQGALPLRVVKRRWMVEWSPSVINPHLGPGLHFAIGRVVPKRAAVVDEQGTPLSRVAGASGLIGHVADATAAQATAAGSLWLTGDPVGTSGIERTYNAQLAGAPSGDVAIANSSDEDTLLLHHFPGASPQPVVTTIDGNIQAVADAVLAPVARPAALVAIDTSSGDVRAIVSHPDGGFPRALVGTYPAGSTFKVVTATGALTAGFTPATPVTCPPSITVGGRRFTNAEHEVLGTISFQEAFAKSCNTAFIGVAEKLTDQQLVAAAATYGINTDWPFPVAHFTGRLPAPRSSVEHAADAIGQGLVQVSPLEMCSIAAAVARGAWQAPALVQGAPPGPSQPLSPTVATDLRLFMRSVVTDGTGTAANVPGDPVFGKTGTAEFGTSNPPATHAWFIGWRDNVAFAVVVEGGGFGGDVAAPLAAHFLSAL